MILDQEIQTLEELAHGFRARAAADTALKNGHIKRAEHLETIIELIKRNGGAFQKCSTCGRLFVSSHCKSYCSNNCRLIAFRNKNKKL